MIFPDLCLYHGIQNGRTLYHSLSQINEESILQKWKVPDSSPAKLIELETIRLVREQNTIDDFNIVIKSIN